MFIWERERESFSIIKQNRNHLSGFCVCNSSDVLTWIQSNIYTMAIEVTKTYNHMHIILITSIPANILQCCIKWCHVVLSRGLSEGYYINFLHKIACQNEFNFRTRISQLDCRTWLCHTGLVIPQNMLIISTKISVDKDIAQQNVYWWCFLHS